MSGPRFVTPELRLTKLIAEPGGPSAAEAVRQAASNLASLRPTCRAEMLALLERAEAEFAGLDTAPSPDSLAALYDLAVGGIGGGEVAGTPGVDETLKSLSDLIDAFRAHGAGDRAAVGVHLQSWRLLMSGSPDAAARDAVLAGLRAVAARYA